MPSFEVATIKPIDPKVRGMLGFLSYPGDKVVLGSATVKMLIHYAFDVQEFQISGGPDWVGTSRYNVEALPPASMRMTNQSIERATPSDNERKMLQTLLAERFGLKFHRETREGPIYILARDKGEIRMEDTKDKSQDSRGGVAMKVGGIADGEAFGLNMSMPHLASLLAPLLERPVLDRTGLMGSYDFHVPPLDPTNRDVVLGVIEAVKQLGLKLESGRGPIETIVIDDIMKPTEN